MPKHVKSGKAANDNQGEASDAARIGIREGECGKTVAEAAQHVLLHVQPAEQACRPAPTSGSLEHMAHVERHVQTGCDHVYVPPSPKPAAAAYDGNVRTPPIIVTNLPERLPILPQEVALIRGHMGELVSLILANDNDPD